MCCAHLELIVKADNKQNSRKILYRIGGVAPFITLALYLSQFLLLFSAETYPTTPEGWFMLFQRNQLLGLFMLNALDIVSITILGLLFLALYDVLKETNPALISIALYFTFLGITMFVSSRAEAVSTTHALSIKYAAASSNALKSELVAAGHAVHASLIISVVIVRSGVFRKYIGLLGILAFIVTLVNDISLIIVPSLASLLMPLNGLLWLIWWLLISRNPLKLAKSPQ